MALGATAAAAGEDKTPQPVVGNKGATILGPRDPARESESPDLLRPPDTDHGAIPNLRYSFSDTHMKMRKGGWSREVTARELPVSKTGDTVRIADMRNFVVSSDIAAALVEVEPGHIREIHWHPNADEWQFYIAGKARMTVFAAQANSRTFDFQAGDVGAVPKTMAPFRGEHG